MFHINATGMRLVETWSSCSDILATQYSHHEEGYVGGG